MVYEIHTETSSLRTVKIMPRNLNDIAHVRSWIRLMHSYRTVWNYSQHWNDGGRRGGRGSCKYVKRQCVRARNMQRTCYSIEQQTIEEGYTQREGKGRVEIAAGSIVHLSCISASGASFTHITLLQQSRRGRDGSILAVLSYWAPLMAWQSYCPGHWQLDDFSTAPIRYNIAKRAT